MNRRRFLAGLGAVTAAPALAHTPYGQWVVYRQKHLLVGAHRGDARTYALAKSVVAGLARELPTAKARVARGPRPERIASLMGTGQLFLAVLSVDEARRMAASQAPFQDYPPTPVRAVADLGGGYMVVAAAAFRTDHAKLVTMALDHEGLATQPNLTDMAVHEGAMAHWLGL